LTFVFGRRKVLFFQINMQARNGFNDFRKLEVFENTGSRPNVVEQLRLSI